MRCVTSFPPTTLRGLEQDWQSGVHAELSIGEGPIAGITLMLDLEQVDRRQEDGVGLEGMQLVTEELRPKSRVRGKAGGVGRYHGEQRSLPACCI